MNKVFSIRGATTILKNDKESIIAASVELIETMLQNNPLLKHEDLINCQISSTGDITAYYPAAAIREAGFVTLPLFSCLEPNIENSLKLCIRILLTVNSSKDFVAKHVYLHEAQTLRKDLIK